MGENDNTIPDLKTTMDASPEGFGKQVWDMEYGAQASHYLYVWNLAFPSNKRTEFIFFCIEKEPPYLTAVYVTPHELIEYWDKILRARRYEIAQCLKTNKWPGYPTNPLQKSEFSLPRWAGYEIEQINT
jgi:exodeoxyribonuclease VIII